MAEIQFRKEDGPPVEEYRVTVNRLMGKVDTIFKKKYSQGPVFDAFEKIIKNLVESDGSFDCGRDNISSKILAVHDVDDNQTLSLWAGPYREYEKTSLKIFCRNISTLVYTGGWKEEVISILFAIFPSIQCFSTLRTNTMSNISPCLLFDIDLRVHPIPISISNLLPTPRTERE